VVESGPVLTAFLLPEHPVSPAKAAIMNTIVVARRTRRAVTFLRRCPRSPGFPAGPAGHRRPTPPTVPPPHRRGVFPLY
jgi:hypothetical protein